MTWWGWVLIGIVVLMIVAGGAWALAQRRRSERLREAFGPEYNHALKRWGSRRVAERDLKRRLEQRGRFTIRPLSSESRERFEALWRNADSTFVDAPSAALGQAHGLLSDVLTELGYPGEGPDRWIDYLSVDHPHLVQTYREADRMRLESEGGRGSTEDLRVAMRGYKQVFDAVLTQRDHSGSTAPG
jgi:predicted nucleic acid-binding protein